MLAGTRAVRTCAALLTIGSLTACAGKAPQQAAEPVPEVSSAPGTSSVAPEPAPRSRRGNPPVYALISYNRMRIVQTPGHIVIHNENGDEARIIPFAAEHKPAGPKSWFGDSVARWDGDTLVVETIRQNPKNRVRGLMSKFIVNEDATVTERFTRLSKDELLYQFTIADPEVYTAPWLGEFSFYAADTGMFPFACHEHNYSLPNILQGARVAEARAAKKP